MHISPSSFSKLRSCEYEWFANSVLRIEPRRGSRPYLDRGNLFHALLERALRLYAKTGVPFLYEGDEGFKQARSVFTEQYDTRGIQCTEEEALELLDAARWQLAQLNLHEWEVVHIDQPDPDNPGQTRRVPLVECSLSAPWGKHELHAIIDVVFRHKTSGEVWHVNWKTSAKDLGIATHVVNDYQLMIEREILRHHGIVIDISALCYLRSVAPTPPPLIYNGTRVSRDKQKLACTWEMYAETVERIGGDPDDYIDLKPILDGKVFSRWCVDATTPEAEATMHAELTAWLERADAIVRTWNERVSFGPTPDPQDGQTVPEAPPWPRRKLGYSCQKCDYALWCRAGLEHPEGMDTRLLAADYRPRDNRSPLVGLRVLNNSGPGYNPNAAYLAFAAKHGRALEPHQEFKP